MSCTERIRYNFAGLERLPFEPARLRPRNAVSGRTRPYEGYGYALRQHAAQHLSPDKPNLASTLSHTAYDQKVMVFYFDVATSPNAVWVPFADLNFKRGAPVMKLTIAGGKVYAGDASSKFEKATPFVFGGGP